MSPDVSETIRLLSDFKVATNRWFRAQYEPEGQEGLRAAINRKTKAAQLAVTRVGCLKLVNAAPPAAVGGAMLRNANPFDMIFQDYFGMSVIPIVSDMIDQAIGVYEDPSYQYQATGEREQVLSELQVFISHSGADRVLAEKLIGLLRSALRLSSQAIRCTSVDGYRLSAGADTDEQLRREVLASPVFIALISEESIRSAYVLFELGARWGAGKQLFTLLAPGVGPEVLRGPIAGLNALQCDSRAQLQQLVGNCGATLGITPEPPEAFDSQITTLLAEAVSAERGQSATTLAGEPYFANAEGTIVAHCMREWPDDFRMRSYCERQQRESLAQLRASVPDDVPPEVFGQIRGKAAAEWPTDYKMRLYAERQQLSAYRELSRSR